MKTSTRRHLCSMQVVISSIVLGLGTYASLVFGIWWLAAIGGYLLTFGMMWSIVHIYERNPETGRARRLYRRGQSYLFMGAPFIVPLMFAVTAHAWSRDGGGQTRDHLLWVSIGLLVGAVYSWGFQKIDHPNYIRKFASLMLESPSKVWIDRFQLTLVVGLIAVTVLPLWTMPGPEKWTTTAMLGVLLYLARLDYSRVRRGEFDPFAQHEQWNEGEFRVATHLPL